MSSTDNRMTGTIDARNVEENRQLDIIDYTQYRRRQRLAEGEARRKFEAEAWEHWCYLRKRERLLAEASKREMEEERSAAAHFAFISQQQLVGSGRWNKIRRLRAIEIHTKVSGLVLDLERWMRVLDTRLEDQCIFIGSYTKKMMIDPELGENPQLPLDQ